MVRARTLPKERVLFRLLRKQGPVPTKICEKLRGSLQNIYRLSDDEFYELWKYVNNILAEVRKFYTSVPCDVNKHVKASNVMLVRTITSMALDTIVQKPVVFNVMLQCAMLLHSVILPNIQHDQTENEISYLLENWWQLDLMWKERMIRNVIMYLTRKSRVSMQHVKRLYSMRSAIALLRNIDDIEELLTLIREKTVMSLKEGQLLLLHLFTLGNGYILRMHDNMKVVMQRSNNNLAIIAYAALYAKAWLSATEELQYFIQEHCIRDIVYHCFRINRDAHGKGILGDNLFAFLDAMHDDENDEVKHMVHNECAALLWTHLKAPGSFVRCNAIEILFMTATVQYESKLSVKRRNYLSLHHKTITMLLVDSNSDVCNITIDGVFETLKEHWYSVPNDIIQSWLNILLDYTKTASEPEIRANIFLGLRKIMIEDQPHTLLEKFLPNFALSIYDEDKQVLQAFIKFLWHAQNELGIPFWKIVPMSYIFNRLETTGDTYVLRELMKLVWLRMSSDDIEDEEIKDEIVEAGTNNLNAIRRFCLNSKSIVECSTSVNLIETLLFLIKKEIKRRTSHIGIETGSSSEESSDDDSSDDEDVDCIKVQIYVDIMATLMEANSERKDFYSENVNILKTIADALPQMFTYLKNTPVKESIIVLFSTIPSTYFDDDLELMEIFIQELCNYKNSDDVLFTLIYLFVKWNKGDTIVYALTQLFTTSLRMTVQHNQDTNSDTEVFQVNESGLELGLRILRQLLHAEHASVVMNKYHHDLIKFWEVLNIIKTFIEKELDNECNLSSPVAKDLIDQVFKEYVSMISILDKRDVFDAVKHLSDILSWVQRVIEPHILSIIVQDLKDHQICINVVRSIFRTFNTLMVEYNSTPKLCCDIILLYCHLLPLASGVAFLKDALDGMILLLEFSKMAYENQEKSLLEIVIPNFISITLTALNRYDKEILATYITNLKILQQMTDKYFSVTNSHVLHVSFMSTLLNNAVSNITTEMLPVLRYSRITKKKVLINKLPYLAKRIVKIILSKKRYQKVCIQVLSKTIMNYTEVDMFSALLIIYKMLQSTDKQFINGLKNLTMATKNRIPKRSDDDNFLERSLNSAMTLVTTAILKHNCVASST